MLRQPKYLSPTSLSKFYRDRSAFYLDYLADRRPPRMPQTKPMSIGSAFDAFAKSYLHTKLYGKGHDPAFEFGALFESQVEPHNRDWAREHGQYVFAAYLLSGCLADLMAELEHAFDAPRFEFTVEHRVGHDFVAGGVPTLGKPDIYFRLESGMPVIFDWKVNGYCSKSATSPKPGYVMVRDGWGLDVAPPSRGNGRGHKNCTLGTYEGLTYNMSMPLHIVDDTWAAQTTMYSWSLGAKHGQDILVGIDQLVAKPGASRPLVRVARHRALSTPAYQDVLLARIVAAWRIIESGHIFDELSRTESDARCAELDEYYKIYENATPNDKWIQGILGRGKPYRG